MRLVVATGDYAHTRALQDARGEGDDLEIRWTSDRPEAIFSRALSDEAPYDVAEMSLATTWALTAAGDPRFAALPVFPSRMYRLSAFYVRPGIQRPDQLAGGRIGVVRYGQTAAVWARALLAERFGIPVEHLCWWVAERQGFEPDGMALNRAGSIEALQEMLANGRLDCLISTKIPEVFRRGGAGRLFPDWPQQEQALFAQSGFLPIMHTVLIRRRLLESRPQLAAALVSRFDAARRAALDWLGDTDASVLPLPLHHGWVEAQIRGGWLDAFQSGLGPNLAVLDAFASHMEAQGLTPRRIAPREVFHHL